MAKAYTFDELMAKNKKIANTPLSELYKPNGDEATEILDIPSLSRDQAAAQASAAAQAAAKALYTGGKYSAPNTLIPGMSYTEWLIKGGMNGMAQKEYDAAVRAAETDYAKTLALYGQNAETLGRAGLTGSGYTDYLTGAGFSAMQGAKVAAADTKALTEAQQRLSYADYLAGVDAQNAQLAAQENAKQEATAANIKSTIDTAIQQGMDDKAIMAMIQQHYGNDFDGYLSGWIANAHTYNDPLVAQNAQSAADAEAAKYREEIFNQLKAGVDPAIVRTNIEYVMKFTGADTSQLDTWMAEAQTAAQPTVDALNEEKTKADRSAALQAYSTMISGGLDKDTALGQLKQEYSDEIVDYAMQTYETSQANIKAEEQNKTFKQLSDELDLEGLALGDIPTSAQYKNAVVSGQLTSEQAEELQNKALEKRKGILSARYDNLTNEDAPEFLSDVRQLYEAGDVDKDYYVNVALDIVKQNIDSVIEDTKSGDHVLKVANIVNKVVSNSELFGGVQDEVVGEALSGVYVETKQAVINDTVAKILGRLGINSNILNSVNQETIRDYASLLGKATDLSQNAYDTIRSLQNLGTVDVLISLDGYDQSTLKGAASKIRNTEKVQLKIGPAMLDQYLGANYPDAKIGTVMYYNDKLIYKTAIGWAELTGVTKGSAGGEENANVLFELIKEKYKVKE